MSTNEINSVNLGSLSGINLPGKPEQSAVEPKAKDDKQLFLQQAQNDEGLTIEDVEEVTKFLNDSSDLFNLSLNFRVNENINRIIVTVVNRETDEVVRQIPTDELIAIAEHISEMVGVLFNNIA